jgi:outer membrane protein
VRSQASYSRLSGNIPDVTFDVPGFDPVTLQAVPLDRYQVEVTAEQTLFAGSRVRNEIRAATHEATAAARRARQEDADVAFDIRRAYWELQRALAAQDALESAAERVDAHLSDVKSRLREGAALQRDLLQAQTRRSEVRLERLEAKNAVRVAQLELDRLLGLPLDVAVRPVTEVEVEASAAPQDDLTDAALAGRPDLAALGEELNALRARLRATKGERWPQLDAVGRFVEAKPNQYFFVEQESYHWNWELGLSLRWNVWDGGRRRTRESELAARLEAAEAHLADARAQVAVDVARKQLEVSHTREAVDVAAENVTEAQETFRVARRQFQEGVALSADVLDAEESWRRAEARRVQAQADYATAKAAVLGALGQVW